MDEKRIGELEDMIYGWYWARNGPSPAIAYALMMRFIIKAKKRSCVEEGAALKRGQFRFIATSLQKEMHITPQSYKTICAALTNHKLTSFQHQSNKKATIVTICKYSDYFPLKRQSNKKPTTKQYETNNKPTNYIGTHDNNIINNNRKVGVEAYLDSQQRGGAPARASGRNSGGELPIYNEIAEIANDRPWLEALAMNYHKKSIEEIKPMFALFRNECLASGRTRHDSIADCKSHFNNWYRIQLQRKAENGKRKNEYPTREEQTETALEAIRMLDEE